MSRTAKEIHEDLKRNMPMDGIPQAAQDRVWSLAWEQGHPHGEADIAGYYEEFRDLALLAAGQDPA